MISYKILRSVRILPTITKKHFSCLTTLRNLTSNNGPLGNNDVLLLQKSLVNKTNHSNNGVLSHLGNETHLRCTILDDKGGIDNLSVDIKRKDLILKYKLMPRDIRKINYQPFLQTSSVPYISVRNDSILINLLNVRALIKSNTVVLFDKSLGSYQKQQLINDLKTKLKQSHHNDQSLPYELRALEAILLYVTHQLTQDTRIHKNVIKSILNDLENHIDTENLRLLLDQNKKTNVFYQQAKLIRDIIDDILQDDDQLISMYLSNPRSDITDHAEVEILLETYYKHYDETVQIIEEIINNIKTTQEIINIILDSNRNQLMLLGLRFSIGIMFLGMGIYVATVYGMNLENFIEEENYGFLVVIGVTTVVTFLFFWRSIAKLHKLEKIAISGNKSLVIERRRL